MRAGETEATVDRVVAALGRSTNIKDIGLESLGVELDARGLPPLNPDTLQIGDLSVFLVGDANGQAPLLHEASDEGHIAGVNASRSSVTCFARRTPLSIVFTDPDVAAVGKRFHELADASFIAGEVDFANQGRARAAQRNRGVLRIYAQRGLTVHELLRLPFYHPVLEEGLRTALRDLARQLPPTDQSDLAACEDLGVEALE